MILGTDEKVVPTSLARLIKMKFYGGRLIIDVNTKADAHHIMHLLLLYLIYYSSFFTCKYFGLL